MIIYVAVRFRKMNYFKSVRKTLTALVGSALLYVGCSSEEEQKSLTDCLIEKNVHLYSAWWCVPCLEQEEELEDELGEEWDYFKENILVQCYDSGYKIFDQCKGKEIYAVPAWEIPGGNPEWEYGVQDLETIAELAGCEYNGGL